MVSRPIIDLDLRVGGSGPYTLSATMRDPESASDVELVANAPLPIDIDGLRAVELDPLAYGQQLAAAVFQYGLIWDRAQSYAAGKQANLRVRLRIAEEARALHALRWECLCDPAGAPVAASGRTSLLRYVPTSDLQPVPTPSFDSLRALVAVACPSDAARFGLSLFDAEVEHQRALQGVAGAPWIASLAPDAPAGRATPQRLGEMLRLGCDLLYLTCHGTLDPQGEPVLWLEQEDGTAARLPGRELVRQLAALDESRRPLLVILAVCHSAGSGDPQAATAALGPQLARAAVPAVIAMQGLAPLDMVTRFVPIVLHELFEHGSIDRAVAVARVPLLPDDPWWLPVLYTRVEDGQLWRDKPPPHRTPLSMFLGGDTPRMLREEVTLRGLVPQAELSQADGGLLYVNRERLDNERELEAEVQALRRQAQDHGTPVVVLRDGISRRELRPFVNPADLRWADIELDPPGTGGIPDAAARALEYMVAQHAKTRIRSGIASVGLFTSEVAQHDNVPGFLLDWSWLYRNTIYPSPDIWRTRLLPALGSLRKALKALGLRQIDLSGRARLGAGLAFGYAFREVTEVAIRVRQGPTWWRTARHNPLLTPFGNPRPKKVGPGADLTLELNITRERGEVAGFVTSYLRAHSLPVGRRLQLDLPSGPNSLISEQEAQAIASQVRTLLQRYRKPGSTVHLFMAAPLGLAVLIGWHLNALTPVQYYELPEGGSHYELAFRLEAL